MKAVGFVGWCAIIALLSSLWTATASAEKENQAPAALETVESLPILCRCEGDLGPSVARIKEVLTEPLKSNGLEFTEEPLENVVNYLQDEYHIPIQIDIPAIEDAGLTSDHPMTTSIRNVTLKAALNLLLKQHHLTHVIRDEVLIITTPEEAEAELVACVYDIRDLIGHNKGNKDSNALVDVIASCVAADTWAIHGGKGAAEIKFVQPGLLVIAQTRAVHDEIGSLLALIRETLRQPARNAVVEAPGMMYGRGGYGLGMEEGFGRGGGYGGEMGGRGGEIRREREPEPADETPFD